jgi:hypothetical protein
MQLQLQLLQHQKEPDVAPPVLKKAKKSFHQRSEGQVIEVSIMSVVSK